MNRVLVNFSITLGLFGSVGLLGLSKHGWQALIAASLCAHFVLTLTRSLRPVAHD